MAIWISGGKSSTGENIGWFWVPWCHNFLEQREMWSKVVRGMKSRVKSDRPTRKMVNTLCLYALSLLQVAEDHYLTQQGAPPPPPPPPPPPCLCHTMGYQHSDLCIFPGVYYAACTHSSYQFLHLYESIIALSTYGLTIALSSSTTCRLFCLLLAHLD